MNRSKRPKRSCRRKVIPLHFQKKGQTSLSRILTTASYQRQIRELIKNNKALASALEDTQCIASANNTTLQNYARDCNQVLLARLKLKAMATTIQNLVGDLDDVLNCLDGCSLKSSRHVPNDEVRIRVQQPDLDTIDESMRSSLGVNTSTEELNDIKLQHENNSPAPMNVSDDFVSSLADSSVTEIYNVQKFISNKYAKKGSKHTEEALTDVKETESQTPPTPQLNLPFSNNISRLFIKELEESQMRKANNESVEVSSYPLKQNSMNIPISEIPVMRHNLFGESSNHLDSTTPVLNDEERRKTFVVAKMNGKNPNTCISASDRRGTFVLNEIINDFDKNPNTCMSASDRRGTFVLNQISNDLPSKNENIFEKTNSFLVPSLLPPASILKSHQTTTIPHQFDSEICNDEKTVFLGEDMELTEIIPSATVSAAASTLLNKNKHLQPENLFMFPAGNIKEKKNMCILPTVLKNSESLSPIFKTTTTPELNLSKVCEKSESLTKQSKSLLTTNELLNKNTDDKIDEFDTCQVLPKVITTIASSRKSILEKLSPPKRSSRRKSLHPDSVMPEKIITNLGSSAEIERRMSTSESKNLSPLNFSDKNTAITLCSTSTQKTETKPLSIIKRISNVLPRKSILTKISETEFDTSISDPISSDSDSDFITNLGKQSPPKRIPNRKSIKPNRRGPYIFVNRTKARKSIESRAMHSLSKDPNGKYDFSSSDSEEETTRKSKTCKIIPKKDGAKSLKSKKGKSSVAVLERDINLLYQDQSRKKRSMNRKVSFANVNLSPTNSCTDKGSKSEEEVLANDINRLSLGLNKSVSPEEEKNQLGETCAPRKSILKNNRLSIDPLGKKYSLSCDKNMFPLEDLQETKLNLKPSSKKAVKSSVGLHSNKLSEIPTENNELFSVENSSSTEKGSEENSQKISTNSKHGKKSKSMLKKKTFSFEENKKISPLQHESCSERSNGDYIFQYDEIANEENKKRGEKSSELLADAITDERIKYNTTELPAKTDSLNNSLIAGVCNIRENFNDQTQNKNSARVSKKSSHKNSEFFGFENKKSKGSKSKRTISGVSERASKKRVTAGDDYMQDFDLNIVPGAINLAVDSALQVEDGPDKCDRIESPKLADDMLIKDAISASNKPDAELKTSYPNNDIKIDQKLSSNSKMKNKKSTKAKQKTNKSNVDSNILTELKEQSVNRKQNEGKQICNNNVKEIASHSSHSKASKMISTDTIASKKENMLTGFECEGRSRRTRTVKSMKEPTLNTKMRR